MNEHLKLGIDLASVGVAIGTVAQWLPPLAALFTIIWTGLRIYEMVKGKGAVQRLYQRCRRSPKNRSGT